MPIVRSYWITVSLEHMNSFFCIHVGGGKLLQSVHIYCDSNKTRETCVHIGYFIHSGVYLCILTKLFTGPRVSEDFQFRVSCFGIS